MKKLLVLILGLCLLTGVCSAAFAEDSFQKKQDYLSEEQKKTLKSMRIVDNTNGEVCELNYTANYRVADFLLQATIEQLEDCESFRALMHELIAPQSDVMLHDRLTRDMPGCSTVACTDNNGTPVMGRNYDLDVNSNGCLAVVHTAPEGAYRSVGVADCAQMGLSWKDLKANNEKTELLLYTPYFTMDGINEKGFACSIMLLNEGSPLQDEGKISLPATLVVRYLLDHADSVDTAIAMMQVADMKHDYNSNNMLMQVSLDGKTTYAFHWMLTDASGNRAVIEFADGRMIVNRYPIKVKYNELDNTAEYSYPKKDTGYLICTNFHVSEGYSDKYVSDGRWRYETLERQLSENPHPDKKQLRDIMASVKYFMNDVESMHEITEAGNDPLDPGAWEWKTIWTDIHNTKDKTLTLWYSEDYDHEHVFGIDYDPHKA